MSELTVAYHESARAEATTLAQYLQQAGYETGELGCGGSGAIGLGDQLLQAQGPILLLVNDDLLHALNCQHGLLAAYQHVNQRDNFHPIMASSMRTGPGGASARVITSLERVSDVIRYMNFWQNAYLTERRKGTATPETTKRLNAVRAVSQEVGETLRLMRDRKPATVHDWVQLSTEELVDRLGTPPILGKRAHPQGLAVPTETQAQQDVDLGTGLEEEQAPSPAQPVVASYQPESVSTPPQVQSTPAQEETTPELIPEALAPLTAPVQPEEPVVEPSSPVVAPLPEAEVLPTASATPTQEDNSKTSSNPKRPSRKAQRRQQKQKRKVHLVKLRKLYSKGRTDKAARFAQEVLHQDPEHDKLRFHYAIGLLQADQKMYRAEAKHQLSLLADSKYARPAAEAQGRLAFAERNYGSARRYLSLAYRLGGSDQPELAYSLGALLQDEFPERHKRAERLLRDATKAKGPTSADAYFRLGQLLRTRGELGAATRAYKAAVTLDRSHAFAAYDLACVLLERGRVGKASKYYRLAKRLNPEFASEDNEEAFTPPTPEMEQDGFASYLTQEQAGPGDDAALYSLAELEAAPIQEAEATKTLQPSAIPSPVVHRQRPAHGLTVLITGASSGIGKATAVAFAKAGARLILTGRRIDRLRKLSARLHVNHSTQVRVLTFDVTDLKETSNMLATLPEDWRAVDVLVNNAGKAKGLDPIFKGHIDHWEEMIDTNIKGLLYMTRIVTPSMVERGRGHVINVCSTAGHEVYPNGAVYCATKHAVDALTKGSRLDLHQYGIRVSQVSPAHVEETEFAKVRFDGDADRAQTVYQDFQPLRAQDVASAIVNIATQPAHVNVQDVLILATQQANSTTINRSGR